MKKLVLTLLILTSAAYAAEPVPAKHASAFVQLKGSHKTIRGELEQMQKDDAYKAAVCTPYKIGKSGSVSGLSCDKPDSALMDMLNRHASSGMQWTLTASSCAVGCTLMHCPYPTGPIVCCNHNIPCL
jgi:hypothetical protein